MRRYLAAVALFGVLHAGGAAEAGNPGESEVQAALTFSFLKFLTWPADRASAPTIPVCVLVSPTFKAAMSAWSGRLVGGRTVEVVEIETVNDVSACAAVFLGAAGPPPESLAAVVSGQGVLTLSDTAGYASRGMAINYYVEQGQVRFEANPTAIRAAGLQLSAQVLRLARIVEAR